MVTIKQDKNELVIGLISDTHVPSRVPKISDDIINDFKKREIDYLFHLGDFTEIDTLDQFHDEFGKENVIAVLGNMDTGEIRDLLPETLEFELYGRHVFMTHGMGGPNIVIKRLNKHFDLSKYDIIIFGHVHRPYNEVWRDGKLYLNPGTPYDKKFTDINSYAYLNISKTNLDFELIYL